MIPPSISESAKIDGAGEFMTFIQDAFSNWHDTEVNQYGILIKATNSHFSKALIM